MYLANLVSQPLTLLYCETIGTDTTETLEYTPIVENWIGNNSETPLCVRVYVHIVRRGDLSGGITLSDLDHVFTILENDFTPFNIFFVWDGEIDYIDSDSWYNNPVSAVFNVNADPTGIDMYFFDKTLSISRGEAQNIPSTAFLVSGEKVLTRVVSHEMGHCLDLYHTFGQACDPNFPIPVGIECCNEEFPNGSNCASRGDRVCDTPPDPGLIYYSIGLNQNTVDPETCEWNGTWLGGAILCSTPSPSPILNYNPDMKNIMSYSWTHCLTHFSPGQGERMRSSFNKYYQMKDVLADCEDVGCGISRTESIHIYGSLTYAGIHRVDRNIIVHTGAQLTVTGEIQFGKGKGIVVRRGAKLVVDGGKLTKCPTAPDWTGIVVEGNSSLPQPDIDNMPTANQAGVVLIKNESQVEWARTAIFTNYSGVWTDQKWGGLVHCENSTFRHNRRAAAFMKYTFPNKSAFVNCVIDAGDFPEGNTSGVTIWATDTIKFFQTEFKNHKFSGIYAYDASIIVSDGCSFEGSGRGISSLSTFPYSANLFVGSQDSNPNFFTDNIIHIETNASAFGTGALIANNQFSDSYAGAIWMVGPTAFSLDNNIIYQSNSDFWLSNGGIVCNRTGSLGWEPWTRIRNNNITGDFGITAIGENREMRFSCNNFTTSRDFTLQQVFGSGPEGRIHSSQGSPFLSLSAGNCFTHTSNSLDIVTSGQTESFSYFFSINEPCYEPLNPGAYNKYQVANANPCGVGDFQGAGNYTLADYNDIKDSISVYQSTALGYSQSFSDLLELKYHMLHGLIQTYVSNSDYNDAYQLLQQEQDVAARLIRFGLECREGNYPAAQNTLSMLPDSIPDISVFKQVQAINLQRMAQDSGYHMSSADSTFLEQIAQSESASSMYAEAILSLLYGRQIDRALEFNVDAFELRSEFWNQATTRKAGQNEQFRMYPNPASQSFQIQAPNECIQAIRVFSTIGAVVYQWNGQAAVKEIEVSVSPWNSGVYIVQLYDLQGRLVFTERIVINH